jgi:hypothetical protein
VNRTRNGGSVRRAVALATAIALGMQIPGCGSIPATETHDALVNQTVSVAMVVNAAERSETLTVPPGVVRLQIHVKWSAKRADPVELAIDARPNGNYRVFAYEIGVGHVPANFQVLELDSAHSRHSALGDAVIGGALQALLPLIILAAAVAWPVYAIAKRAGDGAARADTASQQCCFVWIEDTTSGEIVAGSSPFRKSVPRGAADLTPNAPEEDL